VGHGRRHPAAARNGASPPRRHICGGADVANNVASLWKLDATTGTGCSTMPCIPPINTRDAVIYPTSLSAPSPESGAWSRFWKVRRPPWRTTPRVPFTPRVPGPCYLLPPNDLGPLRDAVAWRDRDRDDAPLDYHPSSSSSPREGEVVPLESPYPMGPYSPKAPSSAPNENGILWYVAR
jgi:hypothetical protein